MARPVHAEPAHGIKLLFENEFVRVTELRVDPGATEPKHSHLRGVTVSLSDYDNETTTYPAGTIAHRHTAFGETRWSDPVTHEARNVGSTEQRTIRIELLKDPSAPAKAESAADPLDALIVCKDTQKLLFENQYVKVTEERVPSGVTQPTHKHEQGVVVTLQGGEVETVDGVTKQLTRRSSKSGDAGWRDAVIHSTRNAGSGQLRNVRIELK